MYMYEHICIYIYICTYSYDIILYNIYIYIYIYTCNVSGARHRDRPLRREVRRALPQQEHVRAPDHDARGSRDGEAADAGAGGPRGQARAVRLRRD